MRDGGNCCGLKRQNSLKRLPCQYRNKWPRVPRLKSIEACESGTWHIQVWPKGRPQEVRRVCFRCRSWRHEGECRLWRGAQDFVRVQSATQSRADWTYFVLTYAQRHWSSATALFRAGVQHWSILRKRLTRKYGKLQYIQTWERHKSGFPHVNVLIGNPRLHSAATQDWRALRRETITPMVVESGFGQRVWIEPMKDADAMAGYLTKLARELTGSSPKDQTPVNAPPHFRRLRASQGLLPPPFKDEELTGKLWQGPLEAFLPSPSSPGVLDAPTVSELLPTTSPSPGVV